MTDFELTQEQHLIVNPPEFTSAMVIAKAGSGKTNTLVRRAINQAKDIKPWKNIAIISFTNKSSQDISLKVKQLGGSQIVTSTFHAFLISNVLSFDAAFRAKEFSFDFNTKSRDLDEWIKVFRTNGIITSSNDNKEDYVFQYALKCLSDNPYIGKYLKNRFAAIYIDEAQDNNQLQYDIVEYLLEIGIQVVLVGDPNQTIYGFRGASAHKFESMKFNKHFQNNIHKLTRNFRCHELISMCAENYEIPNQSNVAKEDDTAYGIFKINENQLSTLINKFNDNKYKNEGLTFLFWSIKKTNILQIIDGFNLTVVELPEFIRSKSSEPEYEKNLDLLFALYFGNNQFEHFYIQTFLSHIKFRDAKKLIKEFKNNLSLETIDNLNTFIKYLKTEDYQSIINSISLPATQQFYQLDKTKNIAMTIHSAKGLEFRNVILMENDFSKLNEENTRNLFYVACTRAEKRLFFVK